MANVGFLRGTQVNIEKLLTNKGAIPGTFYLTSDTNRLYIGKDDTSVAPVNQGIIPIGSLDDLQNVSGDSGQFYYIEGSNILCVRSGGKWVQINEVATLDNLSTVYGETGFQIVAQQGEAAKSTHVNPEICLRDGTEAIKFKGYTQEGSEEIIGTRAILNVYSTEEVDAKLRGFNAMEYRGTTATLTPQNDIVENISNVKNGYSYLLTIKQQTTDSDNNIIVYTPGTLIVAAGTEDEKTGYIPLDQITWTYVTGDSTDTTYKFVASDSGIQLQNSQNGLEGSLSFSAGDNTTAATDYTKDILVNLTNNDFGKSQGVQISHKKYNGTQQSGVGQSTGVIPVISAINIQNGHIENYTVSNYTLPTWSLTQPTEGITKVSVGKVQDTLTDVATLTNSIIITSTNGESSTTSLTQQIASDSLSLTASTDNNQLNINLVWGSF